MDVLSTHITTTLVMLGSIFLLPLFAYLTYKSSGASQRKSLSIAAGVAVWSAIMFGVVRYWQTDLTPLTIWGITLFNLIWPSVLIFKYRDFFVGDGLSLPWLTFVQATRFMGGLFIVENFRNNAGTVFAYTSGIGDIIAAVIAMTILVLIFTGGKPNKSVMYFLIIFGVLDFIAAYSLSFLSTEGTGLQSLAMSETHMVNVYPLGILPFLLVPFAMAYHWLMFLTIKDKKEHKVDKKVQLVSS